MFPGRGRLQVLNMNMPVVRHLQCQHLFNQAKVGPRLLLKLLDMFPQLMRSLSIEAVPSAVCLAREGHYHMFWLE